VKVAVIGAQGQLGADISDRFDQDGCDVYRLSHTDLEITSIDSVRKTFTEIKPTVIVNTAAFHNVQNCEMQPEKAFAVNSIGARNVAQLANDFDAVLFYISTDYVFDGCKATPYTEGDLPSPLNTYGNSKLAGEYFVRSATPRHFILRTSAIYGKHPCRGKGGLNFVELMRKLAREREEVRVTDTEITTPTPTSDVAKQIVLLSRTEAFGIYHATAEGQCSWHEFAREIFALTRTRTPLKVAAPIDFAALVPRPKYSVLENSGLKSISLNVFRPWQHGLMDYLGASRREISLASKSGSTA
jgi:dTDP-4-dehydrorhamnose reductase